MLRSNGALGDWTFEGLAWSARALGGMAPVRRVLADRIERRMRSRADRPAAALRPPLAVEQDKVALSLALLQVAERGLAEGRLGRPAIRALLKTLFTDVLVHRGDESAKDRFRARHRGATPPDFLTISPGKACNLSCVGCYANSGEHGEKLDWATVNRIVRDAHEEWGTRFFVLSGGEPLAWRESHKGGLELSAATRGRAVRDLAHRHARERRRDPVRRGPRDVRRPAGRALRLRLPLHADRARV